MNFIDTCRRESNHCRNIQAKAFIIFMNEADNNKIWNEKSKHVNYDERGSKNVLHISHGQFLQY